MLVVLGSNHRSAPLEFRERVAGMCSDSSRAMQQLLAADGIHEGMILSTCNRFEILAVVDPRRGAGALRQMLLDSWSIPTEQVDGYCYQRDGRDAVRHLFSVASGLDSMILGEPQILGQVRKAYLEARAQGGTGPVLEPLLQRCLAAARRVRSETGISNNPVSVAYTAVQLAGNIFGNLEGRRALLLGSGKMSSLVARHLVAKGVDRILVAGRTYTNAVRLAEEVGGSAVHWEEGLARIGDVDIVVSCTAAPEQILSKADLAPIARKRRGVPLFLIDIAVPRDIDPEVNRLDNVYLYDIDGLQGVIDSNLDERKAAARRAEELIRGEVEAYDRWRQAQSVNQLVVALQSRMNEVGREEIERMRGKFGPVTDQQEQAIEQLAHGMIGKLLHRPIRHLKQAAQRGRVEEVQALFGELFGTDAGDGTDPGEADAGKAEPESDEAGSGPRRALRGGKDL